jgi:hypothetical protein
MTDPTGIQAFRQSLRQIAPAQFGGDPALSAPKKWLWAGMLALTIAIFAGTLSIKPGVRT